MKRKKFLLYLGIISVLYLCFIFIMCGKDNSTSPEVEEGLTVTINLTLPADATGKPWAIMIENDLDFTNGCASLKTGTCSSGANISLSFDDIPAGTYYMFAMVYVVGDIGSEPQTGDYVGIYGLTGLQNPSQLTQPNVIIPATGSVSFDVTLYVMGGE